MRGGLHCPWQGPGEADGATIPSLAERARRRNPFAWGGGPVAFTLVELLVVVAIIGVLAAIATPNFLEAQTRAKVSRIRADLRTVSIGLEAYGVEHGQYPQADNNGWPRWLHQISTPVAYIPRAQIMDPFENRRAPMSQKRHPYFYYGMNESQALNTFSDGRLFLPSEKNGGSRRVIWWLLMSVGPDLERNNIGGTLIARANLINPHRFTWFLYDPSNGTISQGDIIRIGGAPQGVSAHGARGAGAL